MAALERGEKGEIIRGPEVRRQQQHGRVGQNEGGQTQDRPSASDVDAASVAG
jgi:hypothetical protein